MATGKIYRKFGEIWICGFGHMQVTRQTDRHADCNTSHPCRRQVISTAERVH